MEGSLLEKIQQELEVLENVFFDEGVIEEQASEISAHPSQVTCLLKLMPNTGGELEKVAVFVRARFAFTSQYPFDPPLFKMEQCRGLDEDQAKEVFEKILVELEEISVSKKEGNDKEGYLYDVHEKMRDILTNYNDTLVGRCAVCLENFCDNEEEEKEQTFTNRADLVRIDECFHRYHLLCVCRDWFMKRVLERDDFGCEIDYKVSELKKCPICRREVKQEEITYIRNLYKKHPEVGDLNIYS